MSDKKLRVLVVTQYFWPENMRINDLVRDLKEKGHEVTVLTGLPNYPEGEVFESYRTSPGNFAAYHGADVVRVPMLPRGKRSIQLMLNYASFFLSASTVGAFKLRGRQYDVLFVYAVSPIMAAIPALVIGRLKKAPVFVWVLDLWPETLRAVGVIRNPRLLALVGKMVSWIYNRTDYLLLQSHGFLDNVRQYCTRRIADERLVYFPSWAEDDFSSSGSTTSALIAADPSVFTVVFAGNLGEAQDFPAVLDAAQALRDTAAIRWVIVGDGRMSAWLAEQVQARQLHNVHLLGRHPLEAMPGLFAQADALLVTLKTNDVFQRTIPGKVQAYLASGRPLLGMINGEAARVIRESGAGFACDSSDARGLAAITSTLADTALAQRNAMGEAGRQYYLEHYSKPKLMARLESLFREATLRKAGK
ncbi:MULTISPECIES: glycosyltransferase family 4 protein [unclassified Pseudomonas]|uniref:glycosyltransferase family 4 protein n=1 Tax=unclassified Pseudomonas TaxID=196821 RepID=UPI000BA38AF6|nr:MULTISPECIES: glycosyltransferase family 4 protein [unclassified Pseudomonas]MCU1733974.1 glycosyltransferase family 4 protein [Pseudomonas sp. 20P_3.2_Bac4]MCU1742358.1 glycosyltransferase family 4 protein [Pseudomonas sp. 20P_3.2_Bac5]